MITIPVSLVSADWDVGYFVFYPLSVEQEHDEERAVETSRGGIGARLRAPSPEVQSA